MTRLLKCLLLLCPTLANSEPLPALEVIPPMEAAVALDLSLEEIAYRHFVEAETFVSRNAAWSAVEAKEARLRGIAGAPWPWWKKGKEKPHAPSGLCYLDGANTEAGVATNLVVLRDPAAYREIKSVTGQNLTVTRQPGRLALVVTIGAGDYLVCTLNSPRQARP
jgi:hypothetical protein